MQPRVILVIILGGVKSLHRFDLGDDGLGKRARFAELRDIWKGRIELQGVAKYPLELYATPEGRNFAAYVPGELPNPTLELLILLPQSN